MAKARNKTKRSPEAGPVKVISADGTVTTQAAYDPDQMRRVLNGRRPDRVGVSPELRQRVWSRDKGRCRYCQIRLAGKRSKSGRAEGQVIHVVPPSKGGKTTLANLILSCVECKKSRSRSSFEG